MAKNKKQNSNDLEQLALKHTWVGWLGLLVFLSLGILLEVFHGLKMDLYLDVRQETRRLMWTLAHAHGTLFSLVQLGFASSVLLASRWEGVSVKAFRSASRSFVAGLVLLPLGFLLGGVWTFGGDPGWGILLVPVGALATLYGTMRVLLVFLGIRRAKNP
jgi:hypothetical protein